jgi:hypothetical protein
MASLSIAIARDASRTSNRKPTMQVSKRVRSQQPNDMAKGPSLWDEIIGYLAGRNCWVNGGEIERLALDLGYKASNASRRLREMREQGLIIDEERQGTHAKTVWYRIPDGNLIEL